MVAVINFNIGVNFKDAFITEERTLTKKVIGVLESKGKDEKIDPEEIKSILNKKYNSVSEQQTKVKDSIEEGLKGKNSLAKKEAIDLIKEAGKDSKNKTIFHKKDFKFEFNLFGWKIVERTDLHLIKGFGFIPRILIERDLKKDLFRQFIRAKYPNSSEVSRNLITQFAGDLDSIARSIWFIPNLLVEIFLFAKAAKLNIAAKKRYEEDNKVIYERINNLEYIKAVPNYVIIPNIPITFVALVAGFTNKEGQRDEVFFLANFIRYYVTAQKLNSEMNKIVDSLMTIDDLSSNLTIVNESAKILNQETAPVALPTLPSKNIPFQNGDLIFQNVVFAYPKRPHQDILRNFSFHFVQGKIYGIAGKNGIGKSTITKTSLKLYEIKKGKILIGKNNIQEIETDSLHQHVCYQTNRPTFFRMSIAENVYYPNEYNKNDLEKLVAAAKKTGIYDFVNKLPNGFDTILREGGTDLSEGQKQQIMAMKMFIRDYDIYILDEILSNVHPVLKETILANIFAKIKGKTVLVIDHHYSIFNYVDYVYQFTGENLIKMEKSDFTKVS
ncbi:1316_t:CDS:2 [Funneliformis geosporum]|uniref:1316_t:CDS:1 n=1 Tax=Funneliformis geosporum TaxID=1117311 RepID=A0A9W4SAY8_9GLOM|nr:1316_t:CDS:2 [Funneliformis geosporum]